MSGGGGDDESVKKTTFEMSPEQRQLLQLAMPGVQKFAASVPKRYDGSTIAGFDPSQVAGQNMALSAAGAQGKLAEDAARANSFFTGGDIWNPDSNPHLRGAIDAAVRPVTQQYQETVLPAIRSEAGKTGNVTSSKAGVAEGIAARGYQDTVGDLASKITQNQYSTNIDAVMKAIGLTPTIQGTQTVPAATTSAVGDVRQRLAQSLLGENASNFNYEQMAPFLQSKELISLISGIPGGTNVSTANNPQQNPWAQSLGGALTGAAAGSSFGPIGTGVGAVGGAALPWLFR